MSIREEINKLYMDSGTNVKGIMFGHKYVGGVKTENVGIVFHVDKKRPISEIKPEDLIPLTIEIDGKKYPTDVVEDKSTVQALTCYTNFSGEPEILKLQGNPSLLLPIKGGQEIIEYPTGWVDAGGGSWSFSAGTLGFMAVDNEDDRVVGVTNAHVACSVFLANSQRIPDDVLDPYNLYEDRAWAFNGTSFPPGVLGRNLNSLVQLGLRVKRYVPLFDTNSPNLNSCDVSLLSMNADYLDGDSYRIHQPAGVGPMSHMPFATTSEIDDILTSNPRIYSTGRTTGPKGWADSPSCRLRIDGIFVSIGVQFTQWGKAKVINFEDLIRFRYEDNSNFPVAGGDSGSALLAEIGGQMKIIGLVFAGNGGQLGSPSAGTHYGYACRIDRIAQEMNIRSWDSSYVPNFSQGTASVYVKPISQGGMDDKTIVIGGNTYYNVGLTNSEEFPQAPSAGELSGGFSMECPRVQACQETMGNVIRILCPEGWTLENISDNPSCYCCGPDCVTPEDFCTQPTQFLMSFSNGTSQ